METYKLRYNHVMKFMQKPPILRQNTIFTVSCFFSHGGPSPRSCHTMCYDPTRKSIYVLGRYKEYCPIPTTDAAAYESEFFQYFIELDRWVKISGSTLVRNKKKKKTLKNCLYCSS